MTSYQLLEHHYERKKNALYLSVNVFSTKVLIGDTVLTSPTGDGSAILGGHLSQVEVWPIPGQRQYLPFSVILRPRKLVRSRELKPVTSHLACVAAGPRTRLNHLYSPSAN